jgi:hypothetical protein
MVKYISYFQAAKSISFLYFSFQHVYVRVTYREIPFGIWKSFVLYFKIWTQNITQFYTIPLIITDSR